MCLINKLVYKLVFENNLILMGKFFRRVLLFSFSFYLVFLCIYFSFYFLLSFHLVSFSGKISLNCICVIFHICLEVSSLLHLLSTKILVRFYDINFNVLAWIVWRPYVQKNMRYLSNKEKNRQTKYVIWATIEKAKKSRIFDYF